MKTVSEIRFTNFHLLFELFKRQVWAAWPDEPERGMLRKMAKAFDMSERYLSHVKVGRKPIGHATARRLETSFGLSHGWMDADHQGDEPRNKAEDDFVASALMLYRLAPAAAQKEMLHMMRDRLHLENEHAADRATVKTSPREGQKRSPAKTQRSGK
jgi:plasmid maintenance system antidote protein VapI